MRSVALLVVMLAVAAAGCGGNDAVSISATPTDEWAEGYCSAIVDWANELKLATDELRDFESLSREAFEEAGGSIDSATETFIDELRSLGAPDTESGERARGTVDRFGDRAARDLADIERAVENVSGVAGIAKAVVSITAALTSLNKHFMAMVSSLGKVDAGDELQGALEDAESCDDLAG